MNHVVIMSLIMLLIAADDEADGRFSVHGLWPSRFGKEKPVNCKGPEFDSDAIAPILDDLRRNWTDVHGNVEDEYGFWRHEWDKHGRCSPFKEREYFQYGLDLHNTHDLTRYLAEAQITPSNDTFYSFQQIFHAIRDRVGGNPAITCGPNNVLDQISVCIDKYDLGRVINCDRAHGGLNQHCPIDEDAKLIRYPRPYNRNNHRVHVWVGFLVLFIGGAIAGGIFYFWRKRVHSEGSAYERI